jgi:tripartite-type tricarboxylate transporter receptor subunit TctC
MPLALREKIAADVKAVLSDPEINAKLAATGQVVNPGTPKEFEEALNEQTGKVADIGRILGIKAAGN